MDAEAPDTLAHFVAKWQRREPEMQIAEVFCLEAERSRFRAWGALLHELREAMFELSDPGVSVAKTAWWAEELAGMGQGRHRHPLTAALPGPDAPWASLGRALVERDLGELRAEDTDQAVALLLPTASAVLAVESTVFGARESADASRSLAVHWLLQRLPRGLSSGDQARIPMHLFARHGMGAGQLAEANAAGLLQDWGRELQAALPARVAGSGLLRRSRHRFDQAILARLAAGKGIAEPAPPLTLWRAWRAARTP
jgi:hypothetical protein